MTHNKKSDRSRHCLVNLLGAILAVILCLPSPGFSYEEDLSYPPSGIFLGFEGDYNKMSLGPMMDFISTYWYDDNDIKGSFSFSLILGVGIGEGHAIGALAYQRHVMDVPESNEKIPFNVIKIGGEYYFIDSRIQPYARVYIGLALLTIPDLAYGSTANNKTHEGLTFDIGGGLRFWLLNKLSINLGATVQWLYVKTLGGGLDQFTVIPSLGLSYTF
ncbi:MAG: hypothetical protein A2Y69_09740 [Candidatus Aminicenantes bacterium RBG_13_59_9]|nr:MAG: hypothetical protein A2Y69_09740 [Candidatus Aminicenantes bacterium RBG_13_59_9]OGD35164.1 MAG: hypothetical protein A2V45_01520 [Candidatus Aminicenantes bacterium RBG_19FT_COMBO_58_17]